MFSRGEGPLVSMLIPTRGRYQSLLEAIDSLHSLAYDQSSIEYVFKIDSDDQDTINTVNRLSKLINCRTLISPRGYGYLELHNFINDLASISKGDWLFIFNDDARMETQHWDKLLLEVDPWKIPRWNGNNDICLIGPQVKQREISWEFPILRRKVVQLLGHFSQCYSNDAYIYWVMSGISAAFVMTSISISHFINEIDDQTKREGKLESDKYMKLLDSPALKQLQEQDQRILKTHLYRK